MVTKGGGRDFHGSGWANKRHEMFNAKSFFQNYNGQQKSVYRFFVWGYSIGGPVYIPKLFNTQKNKLFFFWSQEYTKQKPATLSGYANMPTLAQRAATSPVTPTATACRFRSPTPPPATRSRATTSRG